MDNTRNHHSSINKKGYLAIKLLFFTRLTILHLSNMIYYHRETWTILNCGLRYIERIVLETTMATQIKKLQ